MDYEKEEQELAEIFCLIEEEKLAGDFLNALLTRKEREEIAKRWALVKRLKEGRPQRSIAAELGLSLCKITRGSRELKRENSAFDRVFRLQEKKNGQK